MVDASYGFIITNQKGHPLVEFKYETEAEANAAAKAIQRAIANAASVRPLS
jgi:hypothetical protein